MNAEKLTREMRSHAGHAAPAQSRAPFVGKILGQRGILDASASKSGQFVDLETHPPDPRLSVHLDPKDCLRFGVIAWQRHGGGLILASCDLAAIPTVRRRLDPALGRVQFVRAERHAISDAIAQTYGTSLAHLAETRLPEIDSCRGWSTGKGMVLVGVLFCIIAAACMIWGGLVLSVLTALATVVLLANTALKATCGILALRPKPKTPKANRPQNLPRISVLVPLFHEQNIAHALIRRLSAIQYPRDLLEICLIMEADDAITYEALKLSTLPAWMRVIRVPAGVVQTKPRALNYALDFTAGDIIGVYDAEDSPDPDQLLDIAARFADADDRLACLQGVLSFYNPHTNWLSRCFSFEYAAWFRVMLPGLERLGLPIPLGGTTLFFRRDILEEIGGWDAHNVTEDADLGMRLVRRGYRCEIIPTVTQEEANSHVWPWIRQRSRWLKGYAVTWAVHMRSPALLLRQLGLRRFLGFQLLFLGALAAFFLAPVLWLGVLFLALDIENPLMRILPGLDFHLLAALYLSAECVSSGVFIIAARNLRPRPALIWIATLPFYFMLGTLAAYKGFAELLFRPFYWDKTEHGNFGGADWTGSLDDAASIDTKPGLERDGKMVTQAF